MIRNMNTQKYHLVRIAQSVTVCKIMLSNVADTNINSKTDFAACFLVGIGDNV